MKAAVFKGTIFVLIIFAIAITGFYFLFLDYRAGIQMNFKYMFYSEENLSKENIFLPSTAYWRARIFSGDSKEILINISELKFGNEDVINFIDYMRRSGLTCSGPFQDGPRYSCEYMVGDRPSFSPFWRITIEFDGSGEFQIPYIVQFFELLP